MLMVESLGHGGCERDAAKLAIGLDRKRFDPHMAAFHEGGFLVDKLNGAGVPILWLPVRSFFNSTAWKGAKMMGEYLRRHRIQLIHALDVPMDIFSAPVARAYGVPVVITSQLSHRNMYPRERRIALRVTDRLASAIVVNSKAVGASLKKEFGFPARKLHLTYNGVNGSEFYAGPGTRPASFAGCVVVGSACVMRPEKRIDWILRAFAEVYTPQSALRLMLVGSGPEVPKLMNLRDELGLSEVCHFEPMKENVADWMRGMDVFINSSETESFPNALLEAMACGCCVIGSNVGGIPELIRHGHDGLIFDSKNPAELAAMLRAAAGDAELRQRMRRHALETAHERFSIERAIARTEALYESLLTGRGIPPTEAQTC